MFSLRYSPGSAVFLSCTTKCYWFKYQVNEPMTLPDFSPVLSLWKSKWCNSQFGGNGLLAVWYVWNIRIRKALTCRGQFPHTSTQSVLFRFVQDFSLKQHWESFTSRFVIFFFRELREWICSAHFCLHWSIKSPQWEGLRLCLPIGSSLNMPAVYYF